LRRRVVEDRYKLEIERMYAEADVISSPPL
jgi:hypothetical protein